MTIVSTAELRAIMRAEFYSFKMRCFAELCGGAAFLPNWHIELLAAKLQAAFEGRIRRLIINIPPRHLKSLAASVALPAWWLGHAPETAIVCATYVQDLSDKFARDCRAVMQSGWYRATFPTRLIAGRAALQELITTKGGSRLATSTGGVFTGRGADLIIIDDPLKPADAISDTRRTGVNDWYDGTLYSRLNDKSRGVVIVVMQRLHEDDLVGHLLKQEGWDLLAFPAIAERDEEHVLDTPLGPRRFTRRAGEALHPARESLETLEQIRANLGTYHFASQYQQTPAPAGGGLVKEAWFKRYGPEERPSSFDQIIQSWDTATKPTELADYSVCTTWGLKEPDFYLLNVLRKKLDYPGLKRAVFEQRALFNPTVILIEDKASGTQLIQDLLEAGLSMVTRFNPEGDKTMRLHAQTATIENGFVHLPREAHWLPDYLHELTVFPNGRHDDQVDSTSQALAWTKIRPVGWNIYELYRQEHEKARNPSTARLVRLAAPAGISRVQTRRSGTYLVQDGFVSVPEDEAPYLYGAGFRRA
jgi:predicted phage terminase large subunit-like protein